MITASTTESYYVSGTLVIITLIHLFNPPNTSERYTVVLFPFYSWRIWGTGKSENLSDNTKGSKLRSLSFSFFFHNLILLFLVLQKKGGVQEIKICYHKTCHFGTRIILNWKQLRVDAKKAPWPRLACLKAGLDYLSPETLYQPRNVIHITSLTNQTLSPISFPHIRSIPQFTILGIANLFPLSYHFSRNLLSFVNTLYKPKL